MEVNINALISKVHVLNKEQFRPVSSEIVFLQRAREDLSEYVARDFQQLNEAISDICSRCLVSIPQIVKDVLTHNKHKYYLPDLNEKDLPIEIHDEYFWSLIDIQDKCNDAFLLGVTNSGDLFLCSLDNVIPLELEYILVEFCKFLQKHDHDERLCATSSVYDAILYDEMSFADEEYEKEVDRLSEEIIANVKRLRAIGVSEVVIKQLFNKEQKLSRLVITEDYRIILPDYNNMEIKMEPLPKAIYLLFLNHPEGIRFKDLPNYRDELAKIYLNLTNRNDYYDVCQSIYKVTNPRLNSINEKCSRIKEAFVSRFDDNLARYYYINGAARGPKVIKLERSMIINTNNR